MLRTVRTGMIMLLAGLVLSTAPAVAQRAGGTIVVGLPESFPNADPHFMARQSYSNVYPHIFESLVTIGENMVPTLQLASSYQVSPDGLTYTFQLREGVLFHNGDTMTSEDVLASWTRYKERTPGGASLSLIEAMSAPDLHTFEVRLSRPIPLFMESIVSPTYPISILPAAEAQKGQGEIDPIGTGPYKLVELISDDRVILERFEDYTIDDSQPAELNGYAGRRHAYVDRIVYQVIPEASTRASALEAGELTITSLLTVPTVRRLTEAGFLDQQFPTYAKVALPVNTAKGITQDVTIRRAIQAAINAEEAMDIAWEGVFELDPSLLFSGSPYYDAGAVEGFYNQNNSAGTKRLLEEAGYNGEPIVIITNENPGNQNTALVIREQLLEVGINANVELTDGATVTAALTDEQGGWNLAVVSYASQPLGGPSSWFPIIRRHAQIPQGSRYDELVTAWLSEPELERRVDIWREIELLINEDVYFILGGNRGITQVSTSALQGFVPFYSMRFWNTWLDKAGTGG